jgi:integrase
MDKTAHSGVYTRKNKYGVVSYIITYTINSRTYKKKIGTTDEGWTLAKAVKERYSRMLGVVPEVKNYNNKNITLDQIAEQYLESIAHKSDYKNTISRYNNHIKAKLGSKEMNEISVADIQNLKYHLSKKISPYTNKKLAPKTINDMLNLVHTIYNYHNKIHYDKKIDSPASSIIVERFKQDNARQRFLTKDEYQVLLDAIKTTKTYEHLKDEMLLYVKILITTGMRTYSALTLRAKDFNFDTNTIRVNNHKSNRIYTSFIHQSVRDELVELCDNLPPESYIFGKQNKPYHRTTINKRLLVVLDQLFNKGITDRRERVVVHTLRHTFGSWLAQQGTSLYIICKLMDHTDISQTQVYSKLAPNSGQEDIASLI